MRLFIAVDLPDEIKNYVFNLQNEINSGLTKINWVHKKNLHLTLKFLGEVEDDKVDKIKERLSSIKFDAFKLTFTKIGFFPSDKKISVIWLGIEPESKLIELQQKVDAEILNLFPDDQTFSAHLTLGRVKMIKKMKDFKKIIDDIDIEPLEFEVKSFKLMKSDLKRGGPKYEVIEEF
jgi:2'-5' RNA ligase